jgi:hypothetical protein
MSSRSVIVAVGVLLTVVVLAAVIPAFVRARNTPASNACVMHLLQLEAAKEQWALENHKATNDAPSWDALLPYVGKAGEVPRCPQGGTYTLGRVGEPPRCSLGGQDHTLPQ